MKNSSLSKLKKNDYFRFKGKSKVYSFDGGGKVKGFNYTSINDISSYYSTKTDRKVEVDFDTQRFVVKERVKFGLLFGYAVYDTVLNKKTPYEFDESEKYKADSKCELLNALKG